ncbi:MAG: MOSC domain-containing protein [Campylobacterota bacterium]|nr:MOSC domain-containing protein [Campylobacterota bacterium]
MSKKSVGKILKLFISKKGIKDRIPKDKLEFDLNGVIDDKFHNKDILRSVLLASLDSYKLVKDNNIDINYGVLGENILIDFNPYRLDIGTQLQIGNLTLEISQECTICSHLSAINENLPTLLKKDRGIFTKVIQSGTVSINDKIYLVD